MKYSLIQGLAAAFVLAAVPALADPFPILDPTGDVINSGLHGKLMIRPGAVTASKLAPDAAAGTVNLWVSTVHDGITDDSAAIAAVLASCGTHGSYNTISTGMYRYAILTQNETNPVGCTIIGGQGPVATEVQNFLGDYSGVFPAFVMNPKMNWLNLGSVKNLYVLNGVALSAPPVNTRGVLTEINKMNPANIAGATASVTVTASGFDSHAVFAWANHGFAIGSMVQFTGTLPSGLFPSTKQIYFVAPENFGPNHFEVATQPGYEAINVGSNSTVSASAAYVGMFQGLVNGFSGRDTVTDGVSIMGFNTGIYSAFGSRAVINNVSMDNNACVFSEYSYDYTTINNLRCNVNIASAVNAQDQNWAITDVNIGAGGVCRVVITPDTSGFMNGDAVFTASVNGNASCNGGPYAASVVDSTHIDLIGSVYAGGTFNAASFSTNSLFINNMPGMIGNAYLKSKVNGAGIQTDSIVQAIDYARGTVRLDKPTTAVGTGVSVTFSNPGGYNGTGGVLTQSIVWRPGAGVRIADSTGGSCNNCFINGHAIGFDFTDGVQGTGVLDYLLTAPNIDTDGTIAPVNSYGVKIQGHSSYINVTNGGFFDMGVPYYVNSLVGGGTNTLSNMTLGSVLSNGFGNGVLFDIVSGGVVMNNIGASETGEAWVAKGAVNTSICGLLAPNLTMLNEPTAPASLWSSHYCGNIVAGGNNN